MAQNPSTCQLCEVETNIEWKCYECDILFCNGCRVKIHSKLKISDSHHVLNIKTCTEENSEIFQRAQLKNKPCDRHKKHMCIFYCDECDELICAACLPESHSNHKFQELEEAFDEKLITIKNIKEETENQFEILDKDAKTLESFQSHANESYAKESLKVINMSLFAQNNIKKKLSDFLDDIHEKRIKTKENISREKAAIQELKQTLMLRKKNIDKVLKSFQAEEIFHTLHDINKSNEILPTYKVDVGKQVQVTFPWLENENQLPFVVIEEVEITRKEVCIQHEVIRKYKLDIPGTIQGILICKNDNSMAWIYDNQNTLRKIHLAENNIKTIREIKVSVQDISMDKDGVLFVLMKENSAINILTKKNLKTFIDMAPYFPISIHITKEKEIIVGLVKGEQAKVIILSRAGEEKQTFEFNKENKSLFTNPFKITTNINRDILVVDSKSSTEQNVLIIQKNSEITTLDKVALKQCSGLTDITATLSGHIILADTCNLSFFSKTGHYLTYKSLLGTFKEHLRGKLDLTPQILIDIINNPTNFNALVDMYTFSNCLDVDSNGLLLVGGKGSGEQDSAALCIAKIKISDAEM